MRKALLLIDVQNDFLPGGALGVPDGDAIFPAIDTLLSHDFEAIIASRDWHPPKHCSFAPYGGQWPVHCVAGTYGADFSPRLNQSQLSHIVHKGLDVACDSYSAFFDNNQVHATGLEGLLRGLDIRHVTLCGLALDYCVAATARDSRRLGFATDIALAACRGIAPDPSSCLTELRDLGVTLIPA